MSNQSAIPSCMRNRTQRGDALALLQLLFDSCSPLIFFDPQYREVLEKLNYGNEGVERSAQEPAHHATDDCDRRRAEEMAERQRHRG